MQYKKLFISLFICLLATVNSQGQESVTDSLLRVGVGRHFETFDFDYYNDLEARKINTLGMYLADSTWLYINANSSYGYKVLERPHNSLYTIYKEFDLDGRILDKWLSYAGKGSFMASISYRFDSLGNIKDSINYDLGFEFPVQEVIKIAEEKQVKLEFYEPLNLSQGKINYAPYSIDKRWYRQDSVKKGKWRIIWEMNWMGGTPHEVMLDLDGITGDILKISKKDLPMNRWKYNADPIVTRRTITP